MRTITPRRIRRILRAVSLLAIACAKPAGLRPPYLQRLPPRNGISIWIVDGTYVRDSIDEEFTNFAQHYAFSEIPPNEFWLDREAVPDETEFFIDHLLEEHRLMQRGMSYDSALAIADSVELAARRAAGDVARALGPNGLPDPTRAHVRLWKHLDSGPEVWIVDGRLVRSVFDVDFTEGGHDHVYEFIPPDEVWIDNDLEPAERPFVLFHELYERNRMAKGMTYSAAHEEASRRELFYRRNPSLLHLGLGAEGWE